jgi:hypothetical protein
MAATHRIRSTTMQSEQMRDVSIDSVEPVVSLFVSHPGLTSGSVGGLASRARAGTRLADCSLFLGPLSAF